MKKRNKYYSFSMVLQRIMEGKITPVNFLILVGFAASLALLYICLHVYSFTLSEQVSSAAKRVRYLKEKEVWLMADYNKLSSPEKIIPEVQKMGMKPVSSVDISELTLYRKDGRLKDGRQAVKEVSAVKNGGGTLKDNMEK